MDQPTISIPTSCSKCEAPCTVFFQDSIRTRAFCEEHAYDFFEALDDETVEELASAGVTIAIEEDKTRKRLRPIQSRYEQLFATVVSGLLASGKYHHKEGSLIRFRASEGEVLGRITVMDDAGMVVDEIERTAKIWAENSDRLFP